jgi:hypothetical protein
MKLKDALKKKKFVVTSEVQSPIDQKPEDLVRSFSSVSGRVDGVSLSEVELEGFVGDTIRTCELLNKSRLEPIYQTTTRDKTVFNSRTIWWTPTTPVLTTFWFLPKITALPVTACRR